MGGVGKEIVNPASRELARDDIVSFALSGLCHFSLEPRAYALGFSLAPLRGFVCGWDGVRFL